LETPLDSALYLANEEKLTLRELLDGAFEVSAVRLVVLSACQTGIIDFRNVPDEAIGFPAGFIQGGVSGVVSSLWPVDDLSTAVLVKKFYHCNLEEHLEPAVALHRAQLWLHSATAKEMTLAEMYERIYRETSCRNAEALRWMRYYQTNVEARPFAHPYYWAGFVFTGA
jgi:CHAT domain-containing protein